MIKKKNSYSKKGFELWKVAKKIIPGGNMLLSKNPMRIFNEKWPTYYSKAKGCYIWDLNNNKYTDMFLMGVGTNILGYSYNKIDNAVIKNIKKSNLSSFNCPEEVLLSKEILKLHKWAGGVKLARTGGEANAIAIRLARAYSNKDNIAICGYHGWHDWYLSANLTNKKNLNNHLINNLEPKGVPKKLKNTVFSFRYNDFKSLKKILDTKNIGTIKMEVIRDEYPTNKFLKKIRDICIKKNIVLIYDECTTGFRNNLGGIHKKFNIDPDIVIYGKTLGNGYAINAIVGRKEIMNNAESNFISSTFWTERSGPTAALATIKEMKLKKPFNLINKKGRKIAKIWRFLSKKYNLPIKIFGIPSLISFKFNSKNHDFYKKIITEEMLKFGFLASTRVYVSLAHSENIINKYAFYMDRTFKRIKEYDDGRKIIPE